MANENLNYVEVMEDLYSKGLSYTQIATELYKRYGIMVHSDSVRYYTKRKKQKKKTKIEKLRDANIEKVLVISDLHIPYNREDILDIINKHKNEVTTIIFGGDLIDNKSISKFTELRKGNLRNEMVELHKMLKEIQKSTPNNRKILIYGNHESRYSAYMARNMSELNGLHTDNILREVVDGFKCVDHEQGTSIYYEKIDGYEVIDNWWTQYNDMIVAHPLSFSRVAGKTAQQAIEYFVDEELDFKACIVAHTHKIASCFKSNKFGQELGCMCLDQPYAKRGNLSYTIQACGYHLAYFTDGKYDINRSRQFVL